MVSSQLDLQVESSIQRLLLKLLLIVESPPNPRGSSVLCLRNSPMKKLRWKLTPFSKPGVYLQSRNKSLQMRFYWRVDGRPQGASLNFVAHQGGLRWAIIPESRKQTMNRLHPVARQKISQPHPRERHTEVSPPSHGSPSVRTPSISSGNVTLPWTCLIIFRTISTACRSEFACMRLCGRFSSAPLCRIPLMSRTRLRSKSSTTLMANPLRHGNFITRTRCGTVKACLPPT